MIFLYACSILQDLLAIGDGIITVDQFGPFCKLHAVLLMPLLAVQDKLRAAAMGRPFWRSMCKRDVVLSDSRKVPLEDLMVDPNDRALFYQLLHDQSTTGLRHLMKPIIDNVQGKLLLRSPDLSECPTEDPALERMFNPVLRKKRISSIDQNEESELIAKVLTSSGMISPNDTVSCSPPSGFCSSSSEDDKTVNIR